MLKRPNEPQFIPRYVKKEIQYIGLKYIWIQKVVLIKHKIVEK